MAVITNNVNKLIREFDSETLWIEPWGKNSLRIRATKNAEMINHDWALLEPEKCDAGITINGQCATVVNGKIRCELNEFGWLTFFNQKGEKLLEECWRVKDGGDKTSALEFCGREFKPIIGGDYRVTLRFESNDEEKIYGLGQRQERQINQKVLMPLS